MVQSVLLFLLPLLALQLQHTVAATVQSNDGTFTYNCPNQVTAENAVSNQCPAYSKSGTYKLLGTSPGVYYNHAPGSYATDDGFVFLQCSYGASGSTSAAIGCAYTTGGTMPLTLSSGQNADCPNPGQTFPQPSGGFATAGFPQTPAVNCPQDSTRSDRSVYTTSIRAGITNSNNRPGGFEIFCVVSNDPGKPANSCYYDGNGTFISGTSSPNCPQQLCSSVPSNRRSLKARKGGSLGAALVAERQVDTRALRARAIAPA